MLRFFFPLALISSSKTHLGTFHYNCNLVQGVGCRIEHQTREMKCCTVFLSTYTAKADAIGCERDLEKRLFHCKPSESPQTEL